MFPILYKRTSTGAIQQWQIVVNDNSYYVISGQVNGALVTSGVTSVKGKNIGKSNETSPEKQALLEAKSKYDLKVNSGYRESVDQIDSIELLKPQLAKEFKDHKQKLDFPCISSPKLDGCLHGSSLLQTTVGQLTIKEIVDNKLQVKVKSYNHKTNEIEYKKVINYYNNGVTVKANEWMELVVGNTILTLTPNHKIFTNNGWKEAQDLDQKLDKVFCTESCLKNQYLSGLIMGDFCLSFDKRQGNGSWRFVGATCNEEYSESLGKLLNAKVRYSGKSGYGSDRWTITEAITRSGLQIDKFYETSLNSRYLGKRKLIKSYDLCRLLTNSSVALWFYSDGSIAFNNGNKRTPTIQLSVHRYSDEQVNNFVKFFKKKFNTNPSIIIDKRVRSDKQSGAFLKFETKDALILLNTFRFYGIKGMEYKNYFNVEEYMPTFEDSFYEFKVRKISANNLYTTKYDIEVEDNHCYFANNILVHNCRANAVDGQLLSRNGKAFVATPHIANALAEFFKKYPEYVLDGELFNMELKDDFDQIVSLVRQTCPTQNDIKKSKELIKFYIFDIFRKDGKETLDSFDRKTLVKNLVKEINRPYIIALDFKVCFSFDELDSIYEYYLSEGHEGQMINAYSAIYQHKRTDKLLKRKEFQDAEFEIIDIVSGKGNREGCAVLVLKCNQYDTFQCSLKGDVDYMKAIYDNKDKYIRKFATVKFQNYTPSGIPRFPTCISIRDYE